MSPAEAWDVLAGIAHGKAVRIGKPLAEPLLRDPSVHLVALAVTAILKLFAAHSSGSAGGTLIAAVLARSDWQKVYGGPRRSGRRSQAFSSTWLPSTSPFGRR